MIRKDVSLKTLLEMIVEGCYLQYGICCVDTYTVDVKEEKVVIHINTEKPFLEKNFFEFLEYLKNMLELFLKAYGYKRVEKGKYYSDFYIMDFVKES